MSYKKKTCVLSWNYGEDAMNAGLGERIQAIFGLDFPLHCYSVEGDNGTLSSLSDVLWQAGSSYALYEDAGAIRAEKRLQAARAPNQRPVQLHLQDDSDDDNIEPLVQNLGRLNIRGTR